MDIDSINFMPPSYQRRRADQQRRWRQVALVGLLCVGLAGWSLMQRGQTSQLRDQAAMYDQQVAAAEQQMKQVQELRREQSELSTRLALWHRLGQPVSHGKVFATLAGELPASVVLTRLDVQAHRPVQAATPSSGSRRSSSQVSNVTGPAADRLALDFAGIAPDDMTLANLLNQLKDHPLFSDVKLHFSRSVRVHGATGRQFRIEMNVPLDRDYQALPAKEGVADARR
ncbi:PilN domain-containing protein [Phycisphaerales bacterium AB-hyl4]|uniref:PilN domain-containing protein n=1 Tax=Natronomicrosphaera hydrolytica TaxID=3242702 RepID=A0ABV4U9A3_9BACT